MKQAIYGLDRAIIRHLIVPLSCEVMTLVMTSYSQPDSVWQQTVPSGFGVVAVDAAGTLPERC